MRSDPRGGPRLIVPSPERKPWPTLGWEIVDWIEAFMVHGPGDVLGDRVTLTEEQVAFVLRGYEIYPRAHEFAGKRRFTREFFSRRKGSSKTELAAFLSGAELDPEGPVRFDGWRREGRAWVPVGRPVHDPYIPMLAVTEGQSEDLVYGALKAILQHSNCPLVNDYDAGEEKITHITAPGRAEAVSSAPSSKEGARTTMQVMDEPHKYISARLKNTHTTMLRQAPKRAGSEAHTLYVSTMYEQGEDSVAEELHRYAIAIAEGRAQDSGLLFDHLQASLHWDIEDPKQLRAAIKEASGDAWDYADVKNITGQFTDPLVGETRARIYWLNQPWGRESVWIQPRPWAERFDPDYDVADRANIVLAFRGSYDNNEASLVGCTADGHVFEIGTWEPEDDDDLEYQVPHGEVDEEIEASFKVWRVRRFVFDPLGWIEEGERWAKRWGRKRAVRFETRKAQAWAQACDRFFSDVGRGVLSHDGSEAIARHLVNATPKDYGEARYIIAGGKTVAAAFAAVMAYDQHRAIGAGSGGGVR